MASSLKDFSKLQWYYQLLIVAGVCGGLLALVWYQFLSPMQVTIEGKQGELAAVKEQVAKSQQQARASAGKGDRPDSSAGAEFGIDVCTSNPPGCVALDDRSRRVYRVAD
jgi:hypothetical protein